MFNIHKQRKHDLKLHNFKAYTRHIHFDQSFRYWDRTVAQQFEPAPVTLALHPSPGLCSGRSDSNRASSDLRESSRRQLDGLVAATCVGDPCRVPASGSSLIQSWSLRLKWVKEFSFSLSFSLLNKLNKEKKRWQRAGRKKGGKKKGRATKEMPFLYPLSELQATCTAYPKYQLCINPLKCNHSFQETISTS